MGSGGWEIIIAKAVTDLGTGETFAVNLALWRTAHEKTPDLLPDHASKPEVSPGRILRKHISRRMVSRPDSCLLIMIGLPDDDPFMFPGRIGHLDIAALDLEEPRAQSGQIAVGTADLMQEPSGGDTQRFPDFRHDPPLRFPIFIPEYPGLITGQIEGVNPLPEIAERIQIGDAAHLAQ